MKEASLLKAFSNKPDKSDGLIQIRNHWAYVMKEVIARTITYLSEHPPKDYCLVRSWKGEIKQCKLYDTLSWPIYNGCNSIYNAKTNSPSHLNLLKDGNLVEVRFTDNGRETWWYQTELISLESMKNLEKLFHFHRIVVFEAMTNKAFQLGIVSKVECSDWRIELTGLDR